MTFSMWRAIESLANRAGNRCVVGAKSLFVVDDTGPRRPIDLTPLEERLYFSADPLGAALPAGLDLFGDSTPHSNLALVPLQIEPVLSDKHQSADTLPTSSWSSWIALLKIALSY